MISKNLQDQINDQINKELYSAFLYLSMSAYFEDKNLPGFAKWLRLQYEEETAHAMKFYDYLVERGARVELKAIDQPQTEWKNSLEVFEDVLEHEKKVTSLINNLYELAIKEKDYPSQIMLHWFIDEQVEEEANASLIVEQIKLIEERGSAMLFLDRELGKRSED